MKQRFSSLPAIVLLAIILLAGSLSAGQRPAIVAEALSHRPDMSNPAERARVVSQIRLSEDQRKTAAIERALKLGLPIRVVGPGHEVAEIMDFEDDRPIYAITTNREATISTAANTTRTTFGVDGAGFAVGVWDAGAVRASHDEFSGGRVNVIDNVSSNSHATHVAGTIGAAGVDIRARGMSPSVIIDSYDWNNDKSQMTSRGASFPNEPGKIYISNHSYGYRTGWAWVDNRWKWEGQGTNQDAFDATFGRYNTFPRDMDSLAYGLPYYLAFWAAGNDRNDNPAAGQTVSLGGSLVTYNPAIHPPGDGIYKGGYDTIAHESLAKNVLTVGAVNDAVTSGLRDLSKATMAPFSSWGPTDDGRIKPDIVANGTTLYSTLASSNSAYGNMSGTSMATPNASGSAQLLVSLFDQFFPGHAMRASTLKGLIIHTADDLGTEGPNYRYGWGLMNTHAAADHIVAHAASPGSHRIVEAKLTNDDNVHNYTFTWDGVSPVRGTLSWTDPAAGAVTSGGDVRTRRLINDLDLLIVGPDESIHQPWVMPYVGSWTEATRSAPAVRGRNSTDNVEQVLISNPATPGIYTAVVTVDGNLTNNQQFYSLLISGSADEVMPSTPAITSFSPDKPRGSITVMTIEGSGFQAGATVSLSFPNEADRVAFSHIVIPEEITARIDTDGMAGGLWDVIVTNPDGGEVVIPASFAVAGPIWRENFEGDVSGWTSDASSGNSNWTLTQNKSRSPSHSFHAPGPASAHIDNLISPPISIPPDATDLLLGFWHAHEFASNHGGVIEFSLNGGNWFDPASSGSGAVFASGGYNGDVTGGGRPPNRNPLGARSAWTGNKQSFSEVTINLDSTVFAGKELKIRWRLGTNNQSSSPGWYIDDIALTGAGAMTIPVPQITVAANAGESPVTGASVDLNVEAVNSDGSQGLIYTWTVNDHFDFPVSFEKNGSENANYTTATFTSSGSYLFQVTARNLFNQSVSSEVLVDVEQTATAVLVDPPMITVPTGGETSFIASVTDQFGLPLTEQPAVSWSVDPNAGTISEEGLFTAAMEAGGPFQLTASAGDLTGFADILVRLLDFSDWQKLHFAPGEIEDPAISGELADPDGDGVYNIIEYALGGNPRQPSREILPQAHIDEGDQGAELVFSFTRPSGIADLLYLVEASGDLGEWTPVPHSEWEIDTDYETDAVTIRKPLSETGRSFMRLQVERDL